MDVDRQPEGVVEGEAHDVAETAEVAPSLEAFLSQLHEANGIIRQLHTRSVEAAAQRQQSAKRAPAVASIDHKQEPLFARRLELLFASQNDEGVADTLPAYECFPEATTDVHALLMSGAIPDGHQKVAHILYPDKVPWPAAAISLETQNQDAQQSLDILAPEHSVMHMEMDVTNPQQEVTLGATLLRPQGEGNPAQDFLPEAPKEIVILRNQKLTTRARGGPVVFSKEEVSAVPPALEPDDRELKAAKEKRRETQKSLALESYREQKLKDRLELLEQTKQAEMSFQEELEKREARRKARQAELQKLTKEGHERRQQTQKEAEEEKKRQEAVESQLAARRKEYHAQLKERLVEWDLKRFNDDGTPVVEPAVAKAPSEPAKTRVHQKTPKELEAEAYIKVIQSAMEERPPVAPIHRDVHGQQAVGSKNKEPWTVEAKAISETYGLTDDEHATIVGKSKGAVSS
mmetsp:Transcript_13158/g.29980  ORF Transcript_13158/g.29980 Transcript_13158/m.29980 type:complete len:461 (+) Transcript_13158:62-1444(+)